MRSWPRYRQAGVAMLVVAGLLLASVGVIAATRHPDQAAAQTDHLWYNGLAWQPSPTIFHETNFTMPDQSRQPISLKQFRGKVVLLSFTSSVCRQQCPLIGRAVALTERLLGPAARDTVLLNVSVDPEADTSRTVNHFAREMGWSPYRWYYVWTSRATMRRIWRAYGIYVPTPPPIYKAGLNVIHTAATAMIDQHGQVRAFLTYPFLPSNLARGVRDLVSGRV